MGQIPTYYNHLSIGRPFTPGKPGNYTSQYFEDTTGPLYPFGYGLSYTQFSLSEHGPVSDHPEARPASSTPASR